MSDTPRTDKEAFREGYGGLFFVPAEFARQLERELNESNQRWADAKSLFDKWFKQ